MNQHKKVGWVVVLVLLFLPWAAGAAEPAPLPRQDLPEPVLGALRTALGAYEEVRRQLAADQTQLLPAASARLSAQLRVALGSADGLSKEVASVLEEAAVVAESLGEATDLETAREAFGEVSRRLLGVAAGDPRLVDGWHVFRCPMTQGFGRWLQPGEELENPYMGQAMLQCGARVEPPGPVPSPVPEKVSSPTEEPAMRPEIPGLKMVDVRDHKYLWRDFDQLQIWESRNQITVAEFRSKAIEKTAQFLGLEGAEAERFAAGATAAVAKVKEAHRRGRGVPFAYDVVREDTFSAELEVAVTGLQALLGDPPRHQLFAPGCKEWLMRLAFGPNNRKEAREAQQAQAEKP